MPSIESQESISILLGRGYKPGLDEQTVTMWGRIIRKFVLHPSNYHLAKQTIYNQNALPEKTVDDILAIINAEYDMR